MRERLRFEAAFASRAAAAVHDALDGTARDHGLEPAGEAGPGVRRYGAAGLPALEVGLRRGAAWSAWAIDWPRDAVLAHGWTRIEDLLVGWCEALGALLGRSQDADGFPRLEPWELVGDVDALDAVQWFGAPLVTWRGWRDRKLEGEVRRSPAGLWLRTVSDPFVDPVTEPTAASNASRMSLDLRPLPVEIARREQEARAKRAARAQPRRGDPRADRAALHASAAGQEADVAALLEAAAEADAEARVLSHLLASLERYGVAPVREALPVLRGVTTAALRAEPEDAVEAVVRALAWRDPARPLLEAQVVLEHLMEGDSRSAALRLILESEEPEAVQGFIAIDLMSIQFCSCEGCAARRQRLGRLAPGR